MNAQFVNNTVTDTHFPRKSNRHYIKLMNMAMFKNHAFTITVMTINSEFINTFYYLILYI